MELLQQFWKEIIVILNEMSPYLLFGFLLAGILKVALPKKFINKHLSPKTTKSVVNASIAGVPLPLCSCGVIPTGISLFKSGASKGASVSFLTSTPQTGVDSILVSYSMLGFPFAVIRVIIAFITGILSGVFTNIFDKSDTSIQDPIPDREDDSYKNNKHSKFYTLFKYAFVDFLSDIAKWIVIGLGIAAVISVLIPNDFFTSNIMGNDYLSMVFILIASIPVYVCATASVPIAAILMVKGLPPGAALVFLMAGPATNAATITVIGKVMGKKTLFIYLLIIILSALFFGWFINKFLPQDWFLFAGTDITDFHENSMLPEWLKYASSAILLFLILNVFRRNYLARRKKSNISLKTHIYKIKGMTCNQCKKKVENNISAIENISRAEVNLGKNLLYVEGDKINKTKIKKKIEDLGYIFIDEQ